MLTQQSGSGPDAIEGALAADRLGAPSVVYFVLSAAAPLTVVAGVVTTAYAVTGITGLPIAFLAVGAVLALFSVGYVAMGRRIANAGAFYAYVTRGLGRPSGIAAAWIALIAYNALQVGLYGAFGAATVPLVQQWAGLSVPWWVLALVSWLLVAVLGLMRVDVNGRLLAVLLTAEVAVILLFDAADLLNPAGGAISMAALSPGELLAPGAGALLVIATTGFVGFESSVVFSEESRDPRRTVPAATYASVGIIAVLYALSSWALTVAAGPGDVVRLAREGQAETIFILAEGHLGGTVVEIARVLFVTSLLAAMISFHNTTARYFFALGRERVLPGAFGRTGPRTGAPKVGSLTQSALGVIVIVIFASLGLDPLVNLFFYGGTFGGFGILLLITATSVSVIAYFARDPGAESRWRRVVAPVIATFALATMVILALANFSTLLGVPPESPLRWILPSIYAVAVVLGLLWALVLRSGRPAVYERIGMGARAVTATPSAHGGRR
ncbi:APC family permease [Spongiactinospora sp. TRM90649]|uniref:APC family permease n=1 Tax=Spongiactinospora sp. TRM90649 TaxID=3031114 RepID=UPI0023F6779B|nr:APC family permease [Spongiactinospora sp. TRM90649]MDF5758280.1 APC family permease [Spongiactinospora sp. TRM90649]